MRSITDLGTERQIRRSQEPRCPANFDRHRIAVVQAEARRLARILEPFGVLRRDQLKRRARATAWHEGGFDAALKRAVASGEIERLPLGFYRKAQPQNRPQSTGPAPGAA
jgi:hypothetical protein